MVHWPDLYLDQMSWRNRADQYAWRRLLVDPEGEEAATGSNLVCLHNRVEWRGLPNFQGAAARYPFAWKGCKILMEVDENGDVVELLISKMKLMLLRMLTITPKMMTLRKQGTSLLRVMESCKESPWDISPQTHNPHLGSPRHHYYLQSLSNLEQSLLENNFKNGENVMILWLMMMIKKKKKITTV